MDKAQKAPKNDQNDLNLNVNIFINTLLHGLHPHLLGLTTASRVATVFYCASIEGPFTVWKPFTSIFYK